MLTTDGPTRSTRGVKSGSPLTSTGDDEGVVGTNAIDASWLAVEEGLAGNAGPEFLHPAPPLPTEAQEAPGPPDGVCRHAVWGPTNPEWQKNWKKRKGCECPRRLPHQKNMPLGPDGDIDTFILLQHSAAAMPITPMAKHPARHCLWPVQGIHRLLQGRLRHSANGC